MRGPVLLACAALVLVLSTVGAVPVHGGSADAVVPQVELLPEQKLIEVETETEATDDLDARGGDGLLRLLKEAEQGEIGSKVNEIGNKKVAIDWTMVCMPVVLDPWWIKHYDSTGVCVGSSYERSLQFCSPEYVDGGALGTNIPYKNYLRSGHSERFTGPPYTATSHLMDSRTKEDCNALNENKDCEGEDQESCCRFMRPSMLLEKSGPDDSFTKCWIWYTALLMEYKYPKCHAGEAGWYEDDTQGLTDNKWHEWKATSKTWAEYARACTGGWMQEDLGGTQGAMATSSGKH